MDGGLTDISRVEVKLGTGHKFNMEDALRAARLRTSTTPAELTAKEQSIAQEILADPTIQVRLRNWVITRVLGAVDKSLWFIPFKKRILGFVWDKLNEEIDEGIEGLRKASNGS